MKKYCFVTVSVNYSCAKQTFDITTYTPPPAGKKTRENIVVYSITDKIKNMVPVEYIKSTASKGSIDNDFESEWKMLAATRPTLLRHHNHHLYREAEGWKIKSGAGKFTFLTMLMPWRWLPPSAV